ncbi:MAG: SAM-dependent chlorinase/fluorinase [Candidatus Polarisedimenticolaceae bacterium]|nr:SAM-dependent chlorinase/fluorinase [Candidatus Polarisedimenticolaceae bacterium]
MSQTGGGFVSQFVLITDFGCHGPYLGQMHAVLKTHAAHIPIIDLLSDAPLCNPRASAYLIAALSNYIPDGAIFLAVVDPGVGGARVGIIVESGRHLFVGPDNGLLSQVVRQSSGCKAWKIDWTPAQCSSTFHGRDIFAPIAARLANRKPFRRVPISLGSMVGLDWPENLYECIYIDHYGNIYTGIKSCKIGGDAVIIVGAHTICRASTFSDRLPGELFWYVNSCGLIEIAANLNRASEILDMKVGDAIALQL